MKRIYQRKSGGTFETSSDRRKDQSGRSQRAVKRKISWKVSANVKARETDASGGKEKQLYKRAALCAGGGFREEIYPDTECRAQTSGAGNPIDVYFEEGKTDL